MKIKKIVFILAFIIAIILGVNISNAAGSELSATSYDAKVGDKVTIKASFTAAAWNISISGDKISGGNYASQTEDLSEKTTSKSFSLDTSVEGTYTIKMTGDITDANGNVEKVDKSITIKVTKSQTTQTPTDPGSAGTTSKSTEAKLSNFGIKPNDFSGFKKNTYNYTHEVPNNVSEITVYATPVQGATVTSGTGKVALKEGDNTIKVVVTAEAGNTQTYTLTIKRRTAAEDAEQSGETSDASLKSLGIKPEEYDFSGFQKDKTEYSVEVPEEVEEIEVYAEATNSKALISGTGKVQLKNGKNKLIVQVTAEDGTTRTYTLEVTRGGTEATETNDSEDGFGLSSLKIKDLILSPDFKTGTYEYTIELSEDLSALDIEAIATDEDAIIEILGNENLQLGENTITILVRNEETDETATYQIIVNKNLSAEEKMSWLKPSTWGREEIIKVAIMAVLVILIVIAIILKIKIAKEKKSEKDLEFPGGEELDKALAEHQELTETAELESLGGENQKETFQGTAELEKAETFQGLDEIVKKETSEVATEIEKTEIPRKTSDLDGTNYIEDIARSKNYKIDYQDDNFNNNGSRRKGKHF